MKKFQREFLFVAFLVMCALCPARRRDAGRGLQVGFSIGARRPCKSESDHSTTHWSGPARSRGFARREHRVRLQLAATACIPPGTRSTTKRATRSRSLTLWAESGMTTFDLGMHTGPHGMIVSHDAKRMGHNGDAASGARTGYSQRENFARVEHNSRTQPHDRDHDG